MNVTILPNQPFELASPGFPQLYPNNAHCRYYFQSAIPGLPLVLEFNEVNTECDNDVLQVGSGDNIDDRLSVIASISGQELVAPIVVPGGQAWVTFDSDLWEVDRGFRLLVHDTPVTGESIISKNDFKHSHLQRSECEFVLNTSEPQFISPLADLVKAGLIQSVSC